MLAELERLGMTATGTVLADRIKKCLLPDKKNMARVKDRHCTQARQYSSWNDNTVVTLMSHENGVAPHGEAMRYSVAEVKKMSIPQSSLIEHYSKNMRDVDLMENNTTNDRLDVRRKWRYIPTLGFLLP